MAKIKWSGIAVVDGRNKINGSVFSKNRYGAYVRTKVAPVNPQTTFQQNRRGVFGSLSQAWAGLTQVQRDTWINAAKSEFQGRDIFGDSFDRQGNSLYIGLNSNLFTVNTSFIDVAPAPVAMEFPTSVVIPTATTSALTVTVNFSSGGTIVPAGFSMVLVATPNVSQGVNFVKNQFRILKVFAAADDISAEDIFSNYQDRFGTPVSGKKLFLRAVLVSTTSGQASVGVEMNAIV